MNSIGIPLSTSDNGASRRKDAKSSYSLTLEDGDGAIAY